MQHPVDGVVGPLILLTDPLSFQDNQALAEWLEDHEFISYRAVDAWDAVGYISDFTLGSFPDLITIPRSENDDAASLLSLMRNISGKSVVLSVFDYSREPAGRLRCLSLKEIDAWLSVRGHRGDA